jgi:signal transduction histidine kinase/ActR/RegA family two-component response regulator
MRPKMFSPRHLDDLAGGLPCELLDHQTEPTVVKQGAAEQFAAFRGIAAYNPECYIGLAISDRNGRTVGYAHLFGDAREINDWDMKFIKTVIQMAGSEFELMEKERDRKRIREQMFRSQKLESLGLLAGGVAHDLNNVLSGIVSYPELLLYDLPPDSKYRKAIETIQASGKRAADIVQDLLTIARGVANTKNSLNLNELIRDYIDSPEFKKLISYYPDITVQTSLDNDLLNINGSLIHIRKTVMNLVSNASEAIEGGGNVIISTRNRYVDNCIKGYNDVKTGEYAILSVSDDGPGIASHDLQRIFEPFYTKKIMGKSGTGLGLSVVWNVVQDHDGYIDVKSDGNGTTFELYFPITREEEPEKQLSLSLEELKGAGESILVVDDVESQRDISCKMLDILGYKTVAVASGEQAVEYLKHNTSDLILLDMIMDPGINGRETYERIRSIHHNQKAVIISGFAESKDVREAQKLGAGRYIKKPVTLEKLGLAVKEELKKELA